MSILPRRGGCDARPGAPGAGGAKTLSLTVLPDRAEAEATRGHGGQRLAKSKAARWRAGVLILVHVIIAVHIAQWLWTGMTVSPVEPSESMETLQRGAVNAGAIFFLLAIASTLIFGRFFCGWGCHVVALQDLCGHWMHRLGRRPKPMRTRLLVWIPVVLALYMFIWPVVKREAVGPALRELGWWDAARPWLGEQTAWAGWSDEFLVQDFWATFPPWYIAAPFLLVCGFASVYFLGNKGFCTYGCPYGGFFGPADIVAPGRIRVTDACEGCGHCTAVCTSNVRVHEEVRDFGMVVDPGCMKCMDCVTVCPKDALYFGFGRPGLAPKRRDPDPGPARKANFDFTVRQELVLALVFVALVVGYRGFMNEVPLLMAVGIAGVGTLCVWKLARLLLDPHVRLQNLQLKHKGRLKRAGWVFAPLAVLLLAGAAWGGLVRVTMWRAGAWDDLVKAPREAVLAGAYAPDAQTRHAAERALALYHRAGPFWGAGYADARALGWTTPPVTHVRLAYLSMVLGRHDDAERHLRTAIESGRSRDDLVLALVQIKERRGASEAEIAQVLAHAVERQTDLHGVRLILAGYHASNGRNDAARSLYDDALADPALRWSARVRRDAGAVFINTGERERGIALIEEAVGVALARGVREDNTLRQAASDLAGLGLLDRAEEALRRGIARRPRSPGLRADLGAVLAASGKPRDAIEQLEQAAELNPRDPTPAQRLAQLHEAMGTSDQAQAWTTEAQRRAEAMMATPGDRTDMHNARGRGVNVR